MNGSSANLRLLIAFERPTRRPVQTIVREIEHLIDSATAKLRRGGKGLDELAQCFNRSALLECWVGRPKHAAVLCQAAIATFTTLGQRASAGTAALPFAVQAWINLLRLSRMTKEQRNFATRLAALERSVQNGELIHEDLFIAETEWRRTAADTPGFMEFIRTVWTAETLYDGLHREDGSCVQTAERLLASQRAITDVIHALMLEARLLMKGLNSTPDRAVLGSVKVPTRRDILLLRFLQNSVLRGDTSVRSEAIHLFHRVSLQAPSDLQLVLLEQLVLLFDKLDRVMAYQIAEEAYEKACVLEDEVSRAWFSRFCAERGSSEWHHILKNLRRTSLYREVNSEPKTQVAARQHVNKIHQKLLAAARDMGASQLQTPVA